MIIFSSAIAGSNRINLEKKAIEIAKHKKNKKVKIINFIDKMIESSIAMGNPLTSADLLNVNFKTLSILKRSALHIISDIISENKNTDFIIDGHFSFWWKNGPINLINVGDIKQIDPDFILSVVPDISNVLKSLKSKSDWINKEINASEIAMWREIELYTADLVSNAVNVKNYIIGSNENPISLYGLMYDSKKPKIYVSYSMAHRGEDYKSVDRFINKLRRYTIVFDPKSVEDITDEIIDNSDLTNLIFNQTVRRDLHFVDQSDFVVI